MPMSVRRREMAGSRVRNVRKRKLVSGDAVVFVRERLDADGICDFMVGEDSWC